MSQSETTRTTKSPAGSANAPKYRRKYDSRLLRLPFVTFTAKKDPRYPYNDYFDVPPVPDIGGDQYGNACDVGKLLAKAFLKYLRSSDGHPVHSLQSIVLSIQEHGADRGTVIGFFCELERWLTWAAKNGGDGLDELSEDAIEAKLAAIYQGASGDER